jgi:DNA-binding transcriptional ArsR family regulator
MGPESLRFVGSIRQKTGCSGVARIPNMPSVRQWAGGWQNGNLGTRICEHSNMWYSSKVVVRPGIAMLHSMRQFKAGVFQALAHPTRVAIVEQLRLAEMSVGQLSEKIGIEQANASQHLAVLRGKFVVATRKEGNQIFYRLSDPLLGEVLEAMRRFFLAHINEALTMLRHEQTEADRPKRKAKETRR